MPVKSDNMVTTLKNADGMAQACNAALAEVHRGLKAIAFYPENHPLRDEILGKAYQAMISLMNEGGVSLIAQRSGLSFADREIPVEKNPMTVALARELFTREIQQLTILPELTINEFTEFLNLLALEPNRISTAGGMDVLLKERGVTTVVANEIDIRAVFSKKMVKEPENEAAAEKSGTQKGNEQSSGPVEASMAENLSDLEIEELIALMKLEENDDRYCQLANLLQIKGQRLKKENSFDRLFPVLLSLLEQNANSRRNATQCECALAIFRQLSRNEMAEHLLDHLEEKDFAKQELVFRIFGKMEGDAADAVIRRMLTGHDLLARRTMAAALVSIGTPAVPQLMEVLKDGRWQVVRTAVSILGEIGSRDAVQGLTQSAYHTDSRVRMEAISSLAKIGGREATQLLIDLLQDKNPAIKKQVIIWMGNTKNEKTLDPLLRLIMKGDITGKSETIKREAILAIGRIGDKRALDILYKLVKKRHWLARGYWDRIKLLAIEAIGQLGGEESKEFLDKLSARGGRIGQASSSVLEAMEQRAANNHE